jgi:hypothetical protein
MPFIFWVAIYNAATIALEYADTNIKIIIDILGFSTSGYFKSQFPIIT